MRATTFGLVDVRCMFVSVERVLDPQLRKRPVVVLSNNDGCAVSRSDEAKALGVRMGDPWFQLRERPSMSSLVACSSNYEEIGAFSARFHSTVASLVADTEVYSVDESFVAMPAKAGNGPRGGEAAQTMSAVQERVLSWTGLPTAAGLGTTKTLAKVAQRHAKDIGSTLVDLTQWRPGDVEGLLEATPVEEIWGIGERLRRGLAALQIYTARDLARADAGMLRRRWSVTLERTARELAGTPCMPVGQTPRNRTQVMYSRMLGATVNTPQQIGSVLAQYAARATGRLRAHGMDASLLQVWCSTSRFREPAHHHTASVALDPPTSDPLSIIEATRVLLPQVVHGAEYNRAGILLTGLVPAGQQQSLWGAPDEGRTLLASAVDEIQAKFGRASVGYGPSGLAHREWDMRRERLSAAATTRWSELLTVR